MNNQFSGPNAWGDYLIALEQATPVIEAIAVTDYYVTDTYEEVLRYKAAGRLPSAKLVFPNVELRLDVATARGGFVNLHLFVSPEDPQHLEELRRLLSRLQFNVMQDRFDCTRADLIRLGKKADPNIADERAALAYGANQFKVNFQKLREVFSESGWAKQHILIAVAGGATDGTSGVREAADQTIRREIEGFAHVIFAGSPAQREFWLGQKDLGPDEIRTRYGGLKPCLHGSDAHKLDDVASPFGNRFSWIKGGLEFDALRQACIDPEGRAYVGEQPPGSAMPSQVISRVQIGDADWATTPDIPLNHGLVAIIGARGSGKTALADVIAAGCDAISPSGWNADENISPSFLARARRLIGDASTTLTWGGGATVTRALDGSDANGHMTFPRARYLSQQFVEELCSAKGVADALVDEIERVIFESHSQDDREWALDFVELRDQQTSRFRQAREREAEAIADISDRIATEFEKESLVATLTTQVGQKKKLIADYTADRAKLIVKGTEAQVTRHTRLSEAAQKLRNTIQSVGNQRRTFIALQDEVHSVRATGAPEMLRQARARHGASGMSDQQWDEFLLIYKGNVDKSLTAYVAWADGEVRKLNGVSPPPGDPNVALIPATADLSALPLAPIAAEMTRLEALFSADSRGNPRQIKRFLNSMMLRHAIAEARGFGADIQRPVLAKIMLAERFYPDFYEQIARLAANHPEGQPDAVRRFEEHVRAPAPEEDDDEKPTGKGGRRAPRSAPEPLPAEAVEWEKNEWAKGWAAIDPALKGVDLRPYVFVTRDKRSSLGGLAAANHLEGLVEKLMGPTMMVRGAAAEIAKLTGPEPEEVFEAIRGRILQDDNFTAKPKGADGLVRLVEAHPTLQRRLLEFIRELPVAKVGSWAASSWGACFTDTGIAAEYQTTLRSWAEQTENSILQKAAQGISRLRRG
jgi:hypothetical protein